MSKKFRSNRNTLSALLAVTVITVSAAFCGVGAQTQGTMRNMTTQQIVRDMGLGINLGNTFEAQNTWTSNPVVWDFETAWGSPEITRAMIDGYAREGFKTLRIPVAWSNLMTGNSRGGTYTISTALMNRVQQIVDWTLANNMYAVVNVHWDGGWFERFPTDSAESMRKYSRIWEQVGHHFRNYSDYLIFESQNEELGWNSVWNPWGGNDNGKQRSYGLVNAINQRFVTIIRGQGGNNPNRHLLIAGYQTDVDRTVDPLFRMPNDTRSPARLAAKVHYYDPFGFTHLTRDEDWARATWTWGTQAERNSLNTQMDKLVTRFINNGVPVAIGEYGMAKQGVTQAEVRNYTVAVTRAMIDRGIAPILWCVQLNKNANPPEVITYFDRTSNPPAMADPQLMTELRALLPTTSINTTSSKPAVTNIFPAVAVKGRTLNISVPASASASDMQIRVVDVRGKVRANFRSAGSASLDLSRMPAGRYFVEVMGSGMGINAVAIVLK